MIDHIVKKFGVPSSNSVSSGGTIAASPNAGLHGALSKFLEKTGEGMSAWLMQSATASTSAEKKQALADAMIDDHLHQLKQTRTNHDNYQYDA